MFHSFYDALCFSNIQCNYNKFKQYESFGNHEYSYIATQIPLSGNCVFFASTSVYHLLAKKILSIKIYLTLCNSVKYKRTSNTQDTVFLNETREFFVTSYCYLDESGIARKATRIYNFQKSYSNIEFLHMLLFLYLTHL